MITHTTQTVATMLESKFQCIKTEKQASKTYGPPFIPFGT